MKNLIQIFISTLILLLWFSTVLVSQKVDPNHRLLWRIESPDLDQASYIYGTMHVNDPRVFNFSDSLYLKIEECKYFALEVHPDTMIKHLIVDPFNSTVNQSLEDQYEVEDLEIFEDEIREKTGLDLSGFSKENLDLIPMMLDKLFKKGKDKNTFLDAHLYHIARILDKEIVGLESLKDHKKALRSFSDGKNFDLPKLIARQKQQKKIYNEILEIYEAGNPEEIYNQGGFKYDTILAHRNHVMVNSSLDYIENGGLFMAVGAAHLSGEEGMIQLLRNEGYIVQPVTANFSKKMLRAELADQELEWIKEEYNNEGFAISIPDHAYDYRPEAIGGYITIRSYPDLGLGHFFFYSASPILLESFDLKMVEKEMKQILKRSGENIKKRDIKYSTYKGFPMLEMEYKHFFNIIKIRYIIRNNYVYALSVIPMNKKTVDSKISNRFFESLSFLDIKKSEDKFYVDSIGAFTLKSDYPSQKYDQKDLSDGYETQSEYTNFFDQESKILHMIAYSYHKGGIVMDNTELVLDGYATNFKIEGDSLIYERINKKFGGKEILREYDDGTFLMALAFVRGNRFYQLLNTGSSSPTNYIKCEEFINNFNPIPYSKFNSFTYENDHFKTSFPEPPTIDTIEDSYNLMEFTKKGIQYSGTDKNSGLNFLVYENEVKPFTTFGNIDSCFLEFQSSYLDYNDTLITAEISQNESHPEFLIHYRNKKNQLDSRCKILFNGDKIYEIYIVQDSSEVSEEAIEHFLNGFKLKGAPTESILFRDSAVVKTLVKESLFSNDTTLQISAAKALNGFSFNEIEENDLLAKYLDVMNKKLPYVFHKEVLQFLSKDNMEALIPLFDKLYLSPDTEDKLKLEILRLLISNQNSKYLLDAKRFLQEYIPTSKDEWEINRMFFSSYDSLVRLKPLFPEIVNLFVQKNSVKSQYLLNRLLEEEVIDYNELTPLHSLIEQECDSLFNLVQENNDDTNWGAKYDLLSIASLYSFSDIDSTQLDLFKYFYIDSSEYFKMEGIKFLLRQEYPFDLTGLYTDYSNISGIIKMYEIERLFEDVNIIPDSMLTLEKYALVASLAYVQEEEYFDKNNSYIVEEFEDQSHVHYLVKCTIQYEYEDQEDQEEYDLLIYTRIVKQFVDFSIPNYNHVFTNYRYLEDNESFESAKDSFFKLNIEQSSQ